MRSMRRTADNAFYGQLAYESQLEAARNAIARSNPPLQRPDVHHVAIAGMDGNDTAQLMAVVYLKADSTASAASFPTTIPARSADGAELKYSIPVVVRKLDADPVTFGYCGGDEIAGAGAVQGVCGFAFVQEGKKYCITNSHVVSLPGADPTDSRCWYHQTLLGEVNNGITLRTDVANSMDGVVVKLGNVQIDHMRIGTLPQPIIDRVDLRIGSTEQFFYIAGGTRINCSSPQYIAPPGVAEVMFAGAIIRFTRFWKLFPQGGARPRPGHSGAAICTSSRGGLVFRGLVFGGTPSGSEVWAFSAGDVWSALFD